MRCHLTWSGEGGAGGGAAAAGTSRLTRCRLTIRSPGLECTSERAEPRCCARRRRWRVHCSRRHPIKERHTCGCSGSSQGAGRQRRGGVRASTTAGGPLLSRSNLDTNTCLARLATSYSSSSSPRCRWVLLPVPATMLRRGASPPRRARKRRQQRVVADLCLPARDSSDRPGAARGRHAVSPRPDGRGCGCGREAPLRLGTRC